MYEIIPFIIAIAKRHHLRMNHKNNSLNNKLQ